jgi:hypothetical protein
MNIKKFVAVVLLGAILLPVNSQLASAASDQITTVAKFRQLRSEALDAASRDELQVASEKLAAADALIHNHPGLVLLRVRLALAAKDPQAAIVQLRRYAEMDLWNKLIEDKGFEPLWNTPEYEQLKERLNLNRKQVGELRDVASISGQPLIEGLAWDVVRKRMLVSAVHDRGIFELGGDGSLKPFVGPDETILGVLGLAVDHARDILWAGTSGLPQADRITPEQAGKAELLKVNLASGKVLARYSAPNADKRSFGDIAVGKDGTVLVSDSLSGDIFRLRRGARELELLVSGGRFGSPQGILLLPGGKLALIADYGSGLHLVNLTNGSSIMVTAPAKATLLGIDGMIRQGRSILAVQNGVTPQRIVQLRMSADFKAVESVTVVAANHPMLDEPSGLMNLGGKIYLAGRSQWSAFKDDGTLVSPSLQPAKIVEVIVPGFR